MTNKLRTYQENTPVHQFYQELYRNQSYQTATRLNSQYRQLTKDSLTVQQVLQKLNQFVDPSDPDLDLPNIVHAYQTAEKIRRDFPSDYQLQITGLIHDLGKILYSFGEPSWAIVGDTYVLGYPFHPSMVYYHDTKQSPDYNRLEYQTELGIYQPHCGLDNVVMSYGHDEYLYQVLANNQQKHTLSERYWKIIRYHSCYPWHTGGAYRNLMSEDDWLTLNDVQLLNKYDLYSKDNNDPVINAETIDYYNQLLEQIFPVPLNW